MPAQEIPEVDVPFADKWTHLVLFGMFSLLWLCVRPVRTMKWAIIMFLVTAALGALIEVLQGIFVSLGRSMELMDWYADAVGGILGISIFFLIGHFAEGNRRITQ